MAVTQGPIFGKAFDEKVTNAAWKTKPSWYIVAEKDRMIQPDVERAMAKKINAKVTSLPTSHVPMLSRPKDVAAVIPAAAGKSISKGAGCWPPEGGGGGEKDRASASSRI